MNPDRLAKAIRGYGASQGRAIQAPTMAQRYRYLRQRDLQLQRQPTWYMLTSWGRGSVAFTVKDARN
jgi:hypothetical protein